MKFIVKWANDDYTLKNFEDVLEGAYANDFRNITLKAVHHSKLTFVCAIPFWMRERFIEVTKQAVNILSIGGIIEVVMDGAVIIKMDPEEGHMENIDITVHLGNYNLSCQ